MSANGDKLALTILRAMPNAEPYLVASICARICRAATSYNRLQVEACNGYETYPGSGVWSEKRAAKAEREEERYAARIKQAVSELPRWHKSGKSGKWGVSLGGDPRGCVVKLTGPTNIYDSWGNDGVCVPYGRI